MQKPKKYSIAPEPITLDELKSFLWGGGNPPAWTD